MSKGRYYMMWTLLSDLASLVLSYLYGFFLPLWVGSWLLKPAKVGIIRAYVRFFEWLPLFPSWQSLYIHNSGFAWLTIALLVRLIMLFLTLRCRAKSKDLITPHLGEPYHDTVKRRFAEYRQALQRWRPKYALKLPRWRYYKRFATGQPDFFWRGRILVIEKSLLEPDRVQELKFGLAREIMYANCEDVAFRDILAYYPSRWTWWQIWGNLLGCYISFPILLMNPSLWPSYWEERVLVADNFAYGLGQGHLLYFHLEAELQQEEAIRQQRRTLASEEAFLRQRWNEFQNKANIQDWTVPYKETEEYHSTTSYSFQHDGKQDHFQKKWSEVRQQILDVQARNAQLGQEELKIQLHRPTLEERRGQIMGRLATEQKWMKERNITSLASALTLPPGAELQQRELDESGFVNG